MDWLQIKRIKRWRVGSKYFFTKKFYDVFVIHTKKYFMNHKSKCVKAGNEKKGETSNDLQK